MDLCRSGRFDWCLVAGDDEVVVFTFRDLIYDATRVWTAQVRTRAGLTGTPEAECGISAAAGVDDVQLVSVSLTDAQTRALGDGGLNYEWDLQVVEDGAVTTTVIAGDVPIQMDVTR